MKTSKAAKKPASPRRTKSTPKKKVSKKSKKKIRGYKGFNKGLICRGHQFKIGEIYSIPTKEIIAVCSNGFHACEKANDVGDHYAFDNDCDHEFAIVESWGDVDYCADKSKHASRNIKVIKKITRDEIIAISKQEEAIIHKKGPFLRLEYGFNETVINRVPGAIIMEAGVFDNDEVDAISEAKDAILIGCFRTYTGQLGCTFINTYTSVVTRVDGKKIKPGVSYSCTVGKFVKAT